MLSSLGVLPLHHLGLQFALVEKDWGILTYSGMGK